MERPNWMEITLGAHKMRLFRSSRFLFLEIPVVKFTIRQAKS